MTTSTSDACARRIGCVPQEGGASLWLGRTALGTCVEGAVRCARERKGQLFVTVLRSLI
jgi:hypothetical protein